MWILDLLLCWIGLNFLFVAVPFHSNRFRPLRFRNPADLPASGSGYRGGSIYWEAQNCKQC